MQRKNLSIRIKEIQDLLGKEKELSIRQISLKIKARWETTLNALELMKTLNIVKERKNDKRKRIERLFSLVK